MDTHHRFRLFPKGQIPAFVAILFLISITMLNAQVRIKEKVEIKPRAINMPKISMSQVNMSSNDSPFFGGSINPNSQHQGFAVLRSCKIIGTGTFVSGEPIPVGIILDGGNQNDAGIGNSTDTIRGNCGSGFGCYLWTFSSCGGFLNVNASGSVSGSLITFTITGDWCCQAPHVVSFTANVTLTAVPITFPSILKMNAVPAILSPCSLLYSYVSAGVHDSDGNPSWNQCNVSSMKFTIENPIEGVKLAGRGINDSTVEGNSIEVKQEMYGTGCRLVWDGKNLPSEVVDVSVRAEKFGMSAVQKVQLLDESRHRYLSVDYVNSVYYGQKTLVTVEHLRDCIGRVPLPENAFYRLEIISGQQFGYLRDPRTCKTGIILDSIKDMGGYAEVEYIARGEENIDHQIITIRASCSDPTVDPDETMWWYVFYNEFNIVVDSIISSTSFVGSENGIHPGDKFWMHLERKGQPGSRPPSDLKTRWTILDPEGAGTLFNADSTLVGTSINGLIPEVCFVAKEPSKLSCSSDIWVEGAVKENYTWHNGAKQLVKKNNLDHFNVTIVPDTAATADTIAFTEGATLVIQAKDKEDKNVELDSNTPLRFSVLTNEEYGTFISVNNDTLKTTPVMLENVLYGDAQAGRIKFAATKKNPTELVTCKIKVEKQDDPAKKGERDVIVVEQTLKIVMEGNHEVQPIIPPSTVTSPLQVNRKSFTVEWTRNGKPAKQQHFRLETDYVDGSGGHDHITPRRTRNNENYGHFYLTRATRHLESRYEDGITQADGKERFDYIASIFGDRMKIRLETTNEKKKKFLWDTISVVEKVPDLQLLGEGANYVLVGGTCEHHGPSDRGIAENCQTPNNNHFGTATLVQIVQAVADSFIVTYPGYRLRINDMSLSFGGKFEVNGSWSLTTDHQEHRSGTNADITLTAYNQNGREVSLTQRQRRILWVLIRDLAGRIPGDETSRNHYHIR